PLPTEPRPRRPHRVGPRGRRCPPRDVRRPRLGGHLRLRRPRPPRRDAGRVTAATRERRRRGDRRAHRRPGRAGRSGLRRGDRADRGARGPAHAARAPGAPAGGGAGVAGRRGAPVRDVARGERRALPRLPGPRAARGVSAAVHHAQPTPAAGDVDARLGPPRPVPDPGVPDHGLARAGDLRLLRRTLRRPPLAHPDRDAGRLGGTPAAQGLPARRHPGPVQGRDGPAARPAEGVLLMTARADDTVLTATGRDWDAISDAVRNADDDRIVVNMGPQHPSTHGVLRLVLEIEGETVTEARCGIGYLHTGIEKNLEHRYWTQGVTFVTRMDYLAPMYNEVAYCLGVEQL